MDRRRMEISLGLLVVATLAVLAYMALQTGHLKGLVFQLRAQVIFDNAAGLVEGAAVRVAGVQVGRVERLTVDFDRARATLLLDAGADLRVDALAAVRARSLLGEKYVELQPVSRDAARLEDGGNLQAVPTGLEVDQVIGQLGPLLQSLDLKSVGPLLVDLQGLVRDNRQSVTQSLERIAALTLRLEQVRFDDPALQSDARVLLQNLRETSELLPGAVRDSEKALLDLAAQARPVLERVETTLVGLEPAIAALPQTLERLNQTLARVDRLAAEIEPMLARAEHMNYDLMKKLLREEGLLVRFRPQEVPWSGDGADPTGEVSASSPLSPPLLSPPAPRNPSE